MQWRPRWNWKSHRFVEKTRWIYISMVVLYGFIWFYMDFLFLNGGFFSPQTMVVWYGFRPPRSGWSGYLKRVVSFEQGMHQQPGWPVWSFYGVVSNRWNNIFELSTIFGMMIPWMTHTFWDGLKPPIRSPFHDDLPKTRSFSGLPPALRPGPRGEAMG